MQRHLAGILAVTHNLEEVASLGHIGLRRDDQWLVDHPVLRVWCLVGLCLFSEGLYFKEEVFWRDITVIMPWRVFP